ncbi:MAG TPA: hypothetical protein VHR66_12455 [Gemmataceae bacterium]|nr:hypothetical protein [Gemmataceae bacterium]
MYGPALKQVPQHNFSDFLSGDPQLGGGDANSKVVFAPGLGSTINGGSGLNTFDDEAGQFEGIALGAGINNWTDPN